MLAGAVIDWAREQGCARAGLRAPADNARARRLYEHQESRATGRSRPLPEDAGRSISEMFLDLG